MSQIKELRSEGFLGGYVKINWMSVSRDVGVLSFYKMGLFPRMGDYLSTSGYTANVNDTTYFSNVTVSFAKDLLRLNNT